MRSLVGLFPGRREEIRYGPRCIPTPAGLEVHVTGRRVLATVVDTIIFSVFFWILAMLFWTSSAEAGGFSFSLGAWLRSSILSGFSPTTCC
jgi:hypothetical protein